MIRLGLCCQFYQEPIRFRHTTATHLQKFSRKEQLSRLSELCLHNVQNLSSALEYCATAGIHAFRILTPLLPRYTHPDVGYVLQDLPDTERIEQELRAAGECAKTHNIRLSFHPDQFILLNSPRADVVRKSIEELNYQAFLAEVIGVETITIHGGGAYGDKMGALAALKRGIEVLPDDVRSRLALENDDRVFTPQDLIPVCRELNIPLVYDVHHHRCLTDHWTVQEATDACCDSWRGREPWAHISSPRDGYSTSQNPRPHADYIREKDWPSEWTYRTLTVDVEAKAKEAAVFKLQSFLVEHGVANSL